MYTLGYDILSTETLKKVWNEIDLIYDQMRDADSSGAAFVDGEVLKTGKGFFIKGELANIVVPTISSVRTGFDNENKYTLLINYYGTGDYYKEHKDDSLKTLNIVLCKDENNIIGGDFKIGNSIIPTKNNSYIFFDGAEKHEVTEVKLKTEGAKLGRFSLTFFFYKD